MCDKILKIKLYSCVYPEYFSYCATHKNKYLILFPKNSFFFSCFSVLDNVLHVFSVSMMHLYHSFSRSYSHYHFLPTVPLTPISVSLILFFHPLTYSPSPFIYYNTFPHPPYLTLIYPTLHHSSCHCTVLHSTGT